MASAANQTSRPSSAAAHAMSRQSSSGAATPSTTTDSGSTTPGSESGADEVVATSTVTTEYTTRPKGSIDGDDAEDQEAASSAPKVAGQTTTVTHIGSKELQHQIDKDGGVHLKPQQSAHQKKRGKKIRAIVSFKPRQSRLDRFNEEAAKDPFRGFYTLFWIGMGIIMLNTFYTSFTNTGKIISLTFWTLFSKDAIVLAISDGVLVGSLFLCVPYAKGLKRRWFRYAPTGLIIQHSWQALMLACVIKWARYREWPWVQSGFFVLHTLSMMMKIHSYLAVNGNMSIHYHRMRRVERQLEERVLEVEREAAGQGEKEEKLPESKEEARQMQHDLLARAWDRAVRKSKDEANAREGADALLEGDKVALWAQVDKQRGMGAFRHRAFRGSLTRSLHPDQPQHTHHASATLQSPENGSAARQRKDSTSSQTAQEELVRDPHPLATHPDVLISTLSREIECLREELMSVPPHLPEGLSPSEAESAGGKDKRVCWPDNVTLANFWDYLLVPTLVYELEYPRTKSIRPLYVLEKTLATFGTFFVIYVITEHFIIPHSPSPETPLLQTFLKLALPMMVNYLLIFYIMFECVCNGFAELTRFADREFYQDWWNATSMDVFSRKWNKPVHSFLLKHVYASSIAGLGMSKTLAMLTTFLLSAFLHELVMAIVSGKIRGYLFAAQMSQLPLILLSKVPIIRDNETLGNLIFWIGLMAGFPLLNIGYLIY